MYTPDEILEQTAATAVVKVNKPLLSKLILGFIGGAMISLGYMAYLRVNGGFVGAAIFPVGLIVILLAGGELITGNMMAVSVGFFKGKVTLLEVLKNWGVITVSNIVGAIFVAYFFGIVAGTLTGEPYLKEALHVAESKLAAGFVQAFFSGIGCNWFVGLAVWLSYGAKDFAGKILAIWFPVMTFVVIGFQHSVANSFLIPFAIFKGHATWLDFLTNFVPVYLGNVVGGAIMISLFYALAYKKH
ncbi:formate/nitrite transporter [Lactococcus hodotermopsidis]|uniref:Formate/nitrite transporter n=1 Tax=Pseudolactococcus hodotermopsidis TaxID=2709157 RepID=A0A6A0BH41_9LACT|nr:formate/nitrite transporter family protein [Lactococcus hodotermopsidis]GFH43107.1 formate/nitrite transporter [Lactococcus hodotermopsidis]